VPKTSARAKTIQQKVLALHKEGLSYRLIGRNVGLSKNTVMEIVRREGLNLPGRCHDIPEPRRVSTPANLPP
jgi:transposase-like protein